MRATYSQSDQAVSGLKQSAVHFFSVCLVLTAYVLHYNTEFERAPSLRKDSISYQLLADDIRTGAVFNRLSSTSENAVERSIRTPGFPLLLAISEPMFGKYAATKGNLLFGCLTLLIVMVSLRSVVSPILSGSWMLYIMFQYHYDTFSYARLVLSEWMTLCLLFLYFSQIVMCFSKRSSSSVFTLHLIAAFCVLTKPALGLIVPLTFVASFFLSRVRPLSVLAAAFFGLFPLFAWIGLNVHRVGAPTLTPFSGYNLFGVAALIGSAEAKSDDSEEFRAVVERINQKKSPPPKETFDFKAKFARRDLTLVDNYNFNVWEVGEPVREELAISPTAYNAHLLQYSFRVISENPRRYLEFVWENLRVATLPPPLILLLALPLLILYTGQFFALFSAMFIFVLLHLLHLGTVALMELMITRYHDVTYLPLLAVALIVATQVLLQTGKSLFLRTEEDEGAY